jgi:putative holliday junction resolvase
LKSSTFLAFDFGERRIGVAVGNDLTETANPLMAIDASNDEARFAAIAVLVNSWTPSAFVVGRPAHPDGKAHAMTARCEKFARQLTGRFTLPAHLVDERYTSIDAERALSLAGSRLTGQRKKQAIDAEAAAQILRRFFMEGPFVAARPESSTAV